MADDDRWTTKDVRLGLVFLVSGALVIALALLETRNGIPMPLWALNWFVGPVLVLLGVNAIVRSLRAGRGE